MITLHDVLVELPLSCREPQTPQAVVPGMRVGAVSLVMLLAALTNSQPAGNLPPYYRSSIPPAPRESTHEYF